MRLLNRNQYTRGMIIRGFTLLSSILCYESNRICPWNIEGYVLCYHIGSRLYDMNFFIAGIIGITRNSPQKPAII